MKKIFAVLLTVCLLAGLMPASAFAEGEKALRLGSAALKDPSAVQTDKGTYYEPNSYIYYGDNGGTPIKWRVLDADKSSDSYRKRAFVMSEYLLKGETKFYDALSWTDEKLNTFFTEQERSGMANTSKNDGGFYPAYDLDWDHTDFYNKKMFFMSVYELEDYVGNYDCAPGLAAQFTDGTGSFWWLRTPESVSTWYIGSVSSGGYVTQRYIGSAFAIRPAFNVNLESVLLTSAAKGGKTAETLAPIESTDTDEWKLTVKDASRGFAVKEKTVNLPLGKTQVTLNYTGAVTGDNEYISVILADAEGAQYYGRVLKPAKANGKLKLTLPADLPEGSYTLKVFNEQCNGDYRTDYSSAFCDVTLNVAVPTVPATGDGTNLLLWGGLLAVSVMALAVYGKKSGMAFRA